MFIKNALQTDRLTNGWEDQQTDGEPRVSFHSLVFPDHLECISDVLKECVTDGPIDGPIDGPTDGLTNRRTDKASYRDPRTHL